MQVYLVYLIAVQASISAVVPGFAPVTQATGIIDQDQHEIMKSVVHEIEWIQ